MLILTSLAGRHCVAGALALALMVFATADARAELVGHWTFDNNVANTKPAAGAQNGDGTLNGPTYDSGDSKVGGTSLHFDGVDDFVDIGLIPVDHPLTLSEGQLSFSLWVLDDNSPDVSRIFDKADQGFARPGYALWIEDEERLTYRTGSVTSGNNPNGLYRTEAGTVPSSVWRHVVYSINGTEVRAYIDGAESTLGTTNNNPIPTNEAAPLKFGIGGDVLGVTGEANTAGGYFSGNLDDLGFWDQALSSGEAISLYNLAESALNYNQNSAEQLFEIHAAQRGIADVEGLSWVYATGLNGADGAVSGAGNNFTVVLDSTAGTGVMSTIGLPDAGDADGDGDVDEADFFHLNDRLFTDVSPGTNGDFNATGQPDIEDFDTWKNIFVAGGGSLDFLTTAPEPTSLLLVVSLGVSLTISSRRR